MPLSSATARCGDPAETGAFTLGLRGRPPPACRPRQNGLCLSQLRGSAAAVPRLARSQFLLPPGDCKRHRCRWARTGGDRHSGATHLQSMMCVM